MSDRIIERFIIIHKGYNRSEFLGNSVILSDEDMDLCGGFSWLGSWETAVTLADVSNQSCCHSGLMFSIPRALWINLIILFLSVIVHCRLRGWRIYTTTVHFFWVNNWVRNKQLYALWLYAFFSLDYIIYTCLWIVWFPQTNLYNHRPFFLGK